MMAWKGAESLGIAASPSWVPPTQEEKKEQMRLSDGTHDSQEGCTEPLHGL